MTAVLGCWISSICDMVSGFWFLGLGWRVRVSRRCIVSRYDISDHTIANSRVAFETLIYFIQREFNDMSDFALPGAWKHGVEGVTTSGQ